ncbi:14170_t:CDS:2, partial [Acaulospora morrowiae]
MSTKFLLLATHIISITTISHLVNKIVPSPYMDEVFHVPQAQNYCEGKYSEWDPKLTTPPGLYIISNIIIYPSYVTRLVDFCSIELLRATNLLFSAGSYVLLWSILNHLHPYQNSNARAVNALSLSMFPINWFFNFLYYTDSGSTFFVLLAYLLALKRKHWKSAVAAGVSVFFRQTNIIWVLFIMGVSMVDTLSDNDNLHIHGSLRSIKGADVTFRTAFREIANFTMMAIRNFKLLVPIYFPYAFVFLGFIAFMKWNGGIVLGDKSNHIATIHFPQIFYFISFAAIFSASVTLRHNHTRTLISLVTLKKGLGIKLILTMSVMALLIYLYTYEHPFLLSDNRHYTFYIWKNIYRKHIIVRYLLIPAYLFAGWVLWDSI